MKHDEELDLAIRRLVFCYSDYKIYLSSLFSKGAEIPWSKLHIYQITKYMIKLSRLSKAQEICGVDIIPSNEVEKRMAFAETKRDEKKKALS